MFSCGVFRGGRYWRSAVAIPSNGSCLRRPWSHLSFIVLAEDVVTRPHRMQYRSNCDPSMGCCELWHMVLYAHLPSAASSKPSNVPLVVPQGARKPEPLQRTYPPRSRSRTVSKTLQYLRLAGRGSCSFCETYTRASIFVVFVLFSRKRRRRPRCTAARAGIRASSRNSTCTEKRREWCPISPCGVLEGD